MGRMVADAEKLEDQLRDALRRPELRFVAQRLRPLEQVAHEPPSLRS